MRSRGLIAILFLLLAGPASAQAHAARSTVRRLAPNAFRQLPAGVRRALVERGCLIPQPWDARTPTNVVHGSFTTAHANEWAILCSMHGVEQILIYRAGAAAGPRIVDSLEAQSDDAWSQDVGGGRLGYSRLIRTRPLREIRAWRVDVDGTAIPQPIDHDAIEDVFLGKSAEAFYHAAGRWYRQLTAD